MLFNSLPYLFFLPFVIVLYFLIKPSFRWMVLLVASYFFIGAGNISSVIVLLLSTVFNYYAARIIETGKSKRNKKIFFSSGLLINIALIFSFKFVESLHGEGIFYFGTYTYSTGRIIGILGISFYSLQNIAYLTEVYQGAMKPEYNIAKYGLFLAFFPKFIAGPIEPTKDFLSQIPVKYRKEDVLLGIQRIIIGLFKKFVLADRIAPSVNYIFDSQGTSSGLTTLVACYLFTLQLYLDFSGYTDIALGTARIFGYRLTENFRLPFRATSISEFWRRWHISLIQWITNYLYYPVVYKLRKLRTTGVILGLVMIFAISGIWHGLGITFIVWSLLHGVFMITDHLTKISREKLFQPIPLFIKSFVGFLLTFHLVVFANIFFRAGTLGNAFQLIKTILSSSTFLPENYLLDFIGPLQHEGFLDNIVNLNVSFVFLLLFFLLEKKLQLFIEKGEINYAFMFFFLLLIFMFGSFINSSRFIYTQF